MDEFTQFGPRPDGCTGHQVVETHHHGAGAADLSPDPAPAGDRGGLSSSGPHTSGAAAALPLSAPAERDAGLLRIETQLTDAGVSPISRPGSDAGRSSGQALSETRSCSAAAASLSPIASDGDGGGRSSRGTQTCIAVPVKPRRSGRKAGGRAGHEVGEAQMPAAGASTPSRDPGPAGGDGGQISSGTHSVSAAIAETPSPRNGRRTVRSGQIAAEAHKIPAAPGPRVESPLIAEIVMAHRQRRGLIRARNRLLLQAKAICRSWCAGDKKKADALWKRMAAGDHLPSELPLVMALAPFLPAIDLFEKGAGNQPGIPVLSRTLEKMAAELPVADYVRGIRGVGLGSLAAIVGEAGDLSEYRSVSAVWKRLGLAVIDGERQRKCADKEKALRHGYSPARRSVMWTAGCGLIGGMGNGRRPLVGEDVSGRTDWTSYEILFVERIRYEAARDPEQQRPPTDEGRESYGVIAKARAKRYVEKRFLRDLFLEWRRVTGKPLTREFGTA